MTVDQIIEGILDREGEGRPPYTKPGDRGGRTSWGISERAHPAAWRNGPPTREDARAIYSAEYIAPLLWIPYEPLLVQVIDFAVNSGLPRAVYWLQRTLGIGADGKLGPATERAVRSADARLVNNALVAARLLLIDQLTDHEKDQLKFEEGWESRALKFLVL